MQEQKAINKVLEHVTYLEHLETDTGVEGWLVNPRGYNHLLGADYYSKQTVYEIYALIFIILLLSGVFSYERKNNMKIILHTTRNGRKRLFFTKIAAMGMITTLIWFLTYAHELFELNRHYGFPHVDAPLQSLPFLGNINLSCRISTFIILVMILRLFLLFFITFITGYLSSKVNLMKSMILSLILFVMPEFLSRLGVPLFQHLSVVRILNGTSIRIEKGNLYTLVLSILMTVIMGILAFYITKKDWCKARGRNSGGS
jgi:hypothetical protein